MITLHPAVSEETPKDISQAPILHVTGSVVEKETPSEKSLEMFADFLDSNNKFSQDKAFTFIDAIFAEENVNFPVNYRQFRIFAAQCLRDAFEYPSGFLQKYPGSTSADFLNVRAFLIDVWKYQVVRGRQREEV